MQAGPKGAAGVPLHLSSSAALSAFAVVVLLVFVFGLLTKGGATQEATDSRKGCLRFGQEAACFSGDLGDSVVLYAREARGR